MPTRPQPATNRITEATYKRNENSIREAFPNLTDVTINATLRGSLEYSFAFAGSGRYLTRVTFSQMIDAPEEINRTTHLIIRRIAAILAEGA